jgi:hypothetical protein
MKKNLLAENMRRFGTKNLQEYGSNEDFKGSGLIVQGRTQIDNNEIQDMIDETDYYGVWNDKEGYWFFPEDESTFSYLEADLDVEFDKRGINARFEGQLDESSDSNNFKVAYAGQGFYGIYDAAIDGPIEGEWPSREAAQAAADKKNKRKYRFQIDTLSDDELELNKNTIHIPNLSWQDQTRIIKWLNRQDYDLKDYKVIEKGDDITIDTFGLDRSETKEIESYLKLQNYKFSSNL